RPGRGHAVGGRPEPQRIVGRLPSGAHRPRRGAVRAHGRHQHGRPADGVDVRSNAEGGVMTVIDAPAPAPVPDVEFDLLAVTLSRGRRFKNGLATVAMVSSFLIAAVPLA